MAIVWDPDPYIWIIPGIERPVAWYGLCFVVGFLVGQWILVRRLPYPRKEAKQFADKLLWYIISGMIVGARLGHVIFYNWSHFAAHPWEIPMFWQGGLASHIGALGVMGAAFLFLRQVADQKMTYLRLADTVVLPTAFVAGCIRIGNFINQEILGTPTDLPWAVTFLHPMDGSPAVPRHPVQLYESACYFFVFAFLWNRKASGTGREAGFFFLLVFGARIALEVFKERQSLWVSGDSLMSMGQILSIPFVLLGMGLLWMSRGRACVQS